MLCDDIDMKLYENGYSVEDHAFLGRIDALAVGRSILLSSALPGEHARNAAKIHEYGHLETCSVNLLRQPAAVRDRYEYRADRAGILEFVTLEKLLSAYQKGSRSCADYCEQLEITERYFLQTLLMYSRIHGLKKECGGYMFTFDPLTIRKVKPV